VVANDELGYGWQTYPERLQDAGISWKIYQDMGEGLDAAGAWGWTSDDPYIGNYGDNSLLYFFNYRNGAPGSPLYEKARTGTDVDSSGGFFDILAADVKGGRLPRVSWIVAPEAYTEHPAWPASYGAWYTAGVLNALTSDPEVWAKTVLLITFNENDGFFDHVVAPYPNVAGLNGDSTVSTEYELFNGTAGTPGGSGGVVGPFGGGVRVPLLAISPWSKGGYVCSESFDHTSLIRFIERRFGVGEPQITPWRRAVFGDLTSAFDFERASDALPKLPSVAAYKPDTEQPTPPSYHPVPPATASVPRQEPGVRPSRRLGYRFDVGFDPTPSALKLSIANEGTLGVHLQARSLTVEGAPYTYTVGAGDRLSAKLPKPGTYDLSLHGPDGFYRHYAGSASTNLTVESALDDRSGRLTLRIDDRDRRLRVNGSVAIAVDTRDSGGWYDIGLSTPDDRSFAHQLAGRLEAARELTSDPQLGRA
jgi:phospholipase C